MPNKCSFKIVSSTTGKLLHGNAAYLHHVSNNGGWDNFLNNVIAETIEIATPIIAQKINQPSVSEPLFKIVK